MKNDIVMQSLAQIAVDGVAGTMGRDRSSIRRIGQPLHATVA